MTGQASHETREIALPFVVARAAGKPTPKGTPRRAVETLAVRLPVLAAGDLVRAARDAGGPRLEHRGREVAYFSDRRDRTTVEGVAERMAGQARHEMSSRGRRPDGPAVPGAAEAVAAFEAGHAIVEDCLARLLPPPVVRIWVNGTGRVAVTDGRPGERFVGAGCSAADGPWMAFPLARRAQAVAVAGAVAEALGMAAEARFGFEILDVAAAERWAAASVPDPVAEAAAFAGMAAPLAGWLGRMASDRYHDLADAVRDGSGGPTLAEATGALAGCVLDLPMRASPGMPDALGLRAAAAAIRARLALGTAARDAA